MIDEEDLRVMAARMVAATEAANKAAGTRMVCVVVLGELDPTVPLRNTLFRLGSNLPTNQVAEVLELGLEACALQTAPEKGSA